MCAVAFNFISFINSSNNESERERRVVYLVEITHVYVYCEFIQFVLARKTSLGATFILMKN